MCDLSRTSLAGVGQGKVFPEKCGDPVAAVSQESVQRGIEAVRADQLLDPGVHGSATRGFRLCIRQSAPNGLASHSAR